MNTYLRKNGEFIYRTFLAAGMIASLWLSQNYVSKQDFVQFSQNVAQLKEGMIRMEGVNSVLLDHETRIRVLERIPTRKITSQTNYWDWLTEQETKFTYNTKTQEGSN